MMLQTLLAYLLIGCFFAAERTFRKGQEAKSLERGAFDRGSTLVIGVSYLVTILSLLAGLVLPQALSPLIRWAGVLLMIGGLGLRAWAHSTLGRFYTRTLKVSDEQKVVQAEPYTHIRHPGYLGVLVMWIGAALATGSVLVLLIVAGGMGFAYLYRIQTEEVMLIATLGESYERYRAKSWRLIPFIY